MQVCQSKQQSAHVLPSNTPDSHQLVCQEPAVSRKLSYPILLLCFWRHLLAALLFMSTFFRSLKNTVRNAQSRQRPRVVISFLYMWISDFPNPIHLSKDCPFFSVSFGELSQKTGWLELCEFTSRTILRHWSTCLIKKQKNKTKYHTGFMTVTL